MKLLYYTFITMLFWIPVAKAQHYTSFQSAGQLQEYFKHKPGKLPIISGHRGTHIKDYPENSIEAFEQVLQHTPAFFEVDPRLTKDSVVILMHDATLDRTTNGTGKVSDYTWAEIQQLYLKDCDGNITPYRIPTLQQAIDWAKGKTILNLDKKDVPMEMTAAILKINNAYAHVMVTVHTAAQALFYYQQHPATMMSAFIKTPQEMETYNQAGIPWKNMIAYIGSELTADNSIMLTLLHAKNVMCMVSAAPVYDKIKALPHRYQAYKNIYASGVDIVESDYPVEVSLAIKN